MNLLTLKESQSDRAVMIRQSTYIFSLGGSSCSESLLIKAVSVCVLERQSGGCLLDARLLGRSITVHR